MTITESNGIRVEDNGRGIPVGIHEKEGVCPSMVDQIGAGGGRQRQTRFPVVSTALGYRVNALSSHLVQSAPRRKIHEQEYSRGKEARLCVKSASNKNGTTVNSSR